MGFFDFLFERKLSSVLYLTTKVKVQGVKFELRKLNPIDYLNGSKALLQIYDTYKVANPEKKQETVNVNKIKEHYADVFLAAVVSPKLSRKENSEGAIWVEHLFSDWDFATELYTKIMEFTYGKKKLKLSSSQKTNALS